MPEGHHDQGFYQQKARFAEPAGKNWSDELVKVSRAAEIKTKEFDCEQNMYIISVRKFSPEVDHNASKT